MTNWTWRPNPGPQEQAHKSKAFELFYGGAAGGGKSEFLVVEALRYVHVPGYTAALFRRTFAELEQPRGLIERSRALYPALGGTYHEQKHQWRFPSGAIIKFDHLEHEKDKYNHQSAEYAFIGFDELTSFTETQYLYLYSRARTVSMDPDTGKPIPVKIRAASNPGNEGHIWVKRRFRPWLDNEYEKPAQMAEIRYFKKVDDDTEVEAERGDPVSLSRTFIPATLHDNPKLIEVDPGYESRLMALPLVERKRLLDGDWDITESGNVFRRDWFTGRILRYSPEGLKWVRYWDLAASVKTSADFTASGAVSVDAQANIYIRDMVRIKKEWPEARKLIMRTAVDESAYCKRVGIEKKAHGLAAVQELVREPELVGLVTLEGIDIPPGEDKLARAYLWSNRAEQGKVYLIDGPWVEGFLDEIVIFDGKGKAHDDQVDTISGGVKMLTTRVWKDTKFLHL